LKENKSPPGKVLSRFPTPSSRQVLDKPNKCKLQYFRTSLVSDFDDAEDGVSVTLLLPTDRTVSHYFSVRKPKNARSKRALDARAPKEVEDPRTAVFVKGTHTGETLNAVMRELASSKRQMTLLRKS
jgi:hypothetical protein